MCNRTSCRRALGCLLIFLAQVFLVAQDSAPQQRTFHEPKAAVEKALADGQITLSGRLPTLEGFVTDSGLSLERFQRGYYQYSVSVLPVDAATSTVRVSAKVTAWYKDETPSKSGYRVLPSNGRLESDFLDNVADLLKGNTGTAAANTNAAPAASEMEAAPDTALPTSQPKASVFSKAIHDASSPRPAAPSVEDSATERRIQQLTQQGDSLREILRNQARPSNLAIVRKAGTPVLDRPIEGAKAVLVADAEDEFQIVDTTGDWVHVQVSGISRGWLRRDQVDLPSATNASLSSLENDPRSFDRAPAFQQTREEVSVFPGKWEPLDGKKVDIIWVQPSGQKSFGTEPKLNLVKTVLQKSYDKVSGSTPSVAGVVVILDSEDGGMAAATMAALQQWHAGHLPDGAFWKRCLLDPADVFKPGE